jgi:MoaA/NifB/PqqE/SkfB family radical SAM enzyme
MRIEEYRDEYNPFNKFKLLTWANYWRQFEKGSIPAPVAVSVDPVNRCNHKCIWCNSGYLLKQNKGIMSRAFLTDLAGFLSRWGVKSVCVGGGGESLLNPHTGEFIVNCSRKDGLEVAVVTNGSNIDRFLDELSLCRWVGVSVDAGSEQTYSKLHRPLSTNFAKLTNNIKRLARKNKTNKDFELTYKFLMHPENINELYTAASLAKDLGANRFHARPVGEVWFDLRYRRLFSAEHLKTIKKQMDKISRLRSEDFKIYTIISRNYTRTLEIKHSFSKCYAVFMTCVFQPNGVVSLCCDRRGYSSLNLCTLKHPEEVLEHWGSKRHKNIAKNIKLKNCPRCTYSSHNEIYENVIKDDSMFVNFI